MALVAESFGDLNRLKLARDSGIAQRILQTASLNNDAARATRSARSQDLSTLMQAAQQANENRRLRKGAEAQSEERRLARALQMMQMGDVNSRFAQSQAQQRELAEAGRDFTGERERFGDSLGLVQSGLLPERAASAYGLPESRLPALNAQREAGKFSEMLKRKEVDQTATMTNEAMAPVLEAVKQLESQYDVLKQSDDGEFKAEDIAASAFKIAREHGVTVPFEAGTLGAKPEALLKYADDIQAQYVNALLKQGSIGDAVIWDAKSRMFKARPIASRFEDPSTNSVAQPSSRDALMDRILQMQTGQ